MNMEEKLMFTTNKIMDFLVKNKEQCGIIIARFVHECYKNKELFDQDGKVIALEEFDGDDNHTCVLMTQKFCKAYHTYDATKELLNINKSIMMLLCLHVLKSFQEADPTLEDIADMENAMKRVVLKDQDFFVELFMVALICAVKMVAKEFAKK